MDFAKLGMCIDILQVSLESLMGKVCQFLTELSAGDTSIFWFRDDNFSKCQWIVMRLDMHIDIVEICFRIATGQICQF